MNTQPIIERKPVISVTNPSGKLTILSISPHEEDHLSLHAIIGHSKWKLFTARDLASALSLLHDHEIAVLLCERDLRPGTWIDILEHITLLPHAPSLIVSSRPTDDRLWAEALNLGAWDVLAKPFDHIGVIRSVKSAWQRWHDQIHPQALAVRTMSAAS
jgi:DNA-binding NtrC family response regulator